MKTLLRRLAFSSVGGLLAATLSSTAVRADEPAAKPDASSPSATAAEKDLALRLTCSTPPNKASSRSRPKGSATAA